jgi:autotransporter-associated beta strand protein
LYDYSSIVPKIENDSTTLQTLNLPVLLSGVNVGSAELDPSSGDLLLTANAPVSLAAANTQLRFYSSAGHVVTFNGPIFGGSTNSCALMGTATAGGKGAFVIFANTNSCTNLFLFAGIARLAAASVTTNLVLLGDTNNATTAPATLEMDNGFTNSSPVVILAGSTNFRTIGNTAIGSDTADFTGPISLGTNLVWLANAAGTLEFDGNVDFQNPNGVPPRSLTVSGAGNTVFTGSFTNALTGISVLVKTNSGTLTLTSTTNANHILFNHGGGVISIANAGAIGIPTGVSYPNKFNFSATAMLSVTNSFTLGRNASGSDNAGFEIAGGNTGIFDVAANSTLTIDGPIIDLPGGGSGNLAKTSAGTLVLQQPNTYSGATTISNGVLTLTGNGSIGNSSNIAIASGATFDVSSLVSTFALGSGQTLTGNGGTGNFSGNVNLNSGSLVLNYTNGVPSLQVSNGQLSFNNNAVTVTVAGAALPAGSYELVAAGPGGSISGTVSTSSLTVDGAGVAAGALTSLQITGGNFYLVVNYPPLATPTTVTRNAGISMLKIALGDLATNWSDADGDAVSLVGVGISTNGVMLSTNGGFLIYNNANNVNDQFSYTIADTQGAMTNGLVNIIVNQTITGQVQSFSVISGSPRLAFAGIPGYGYSVQRSTNLPVWVTIWTTNAPNNGVFNFTDNFSDLGGVPPSSAYYRLNWQP